MQTIQFKIDNTSLNFIETLFNNLKIGIKDFSIIKENIVSKVDTQEQYNSSYFRAKESEYIYYLVELYGEIQREKLGIQRILYKDKEKAKKWRNNIIKIVDPDRSTHPKATESAKKLHEIYKEMIKYAK